MTSFSINELKNLHKCSSNEELLTIAMNIGAYTRGYKPDDSYRDLIIASIITRAPRMTLEQAEYLIKRMNKNKV
jgi:hypothetical protein